MLDRNTLIAFTNHGTVDAREEVEVDAAFHLEAYSDETREELFARACAALRSAGIRVKAGYAPTLDTDPEAAKLITKALYRY